MEDRKNFCRCAAFACAVLLAGAALSVQGQTCTTQGEMPGSVRAALLAASQQLVQGVASGNSSAIKTAIAPQVAADSSGILSAVSDVVPKVKGATFTVDDLYLLDATDLKPNADSVRFYCGVFNLPQRTVVSFGSLPDGRYALALIHATGIAQPQQMAVIFQDSNDQWKLAGFSSRQLTMAGHDSLWYWKQARMYANKNQKWNAYFYYTTARYLAVPVDYLSSTNFEKLVQEQDSVRLADMPGKQPMHLTANGQIFDVTQMETSDALGRLDLVMHFNAKDTTNPAATRQLNTVVMQAMLQAHPELKDAFQGLWVYAVAPGQAPFGIELPMRQIP